MIGISFEDLSTGRCKYPISGMIPCLAAPRRPSENDWNHPILTMWYVNSDLSDGEEGEVWQLVKYKDKHRAQWRRIAHENDKGAIKRIVPVSPDWENEPLEANALGEVEIKGSVSTDDDSSPIDVFSDENRLGVELGISKLVKEAPDHPGHVGVCSFDSAHFDRSEHGHISLKGDLGPRISRIRIYNKELTPDKRGAISLATCTAQSQNGANAFKIIGNEICLVSQISRCSDKDRIDFAGVCSFDKDDFSITNNGQVSLAEGSAAIKAIRVDTQQGSGQTYVHAKKGEISIGARSVPFLGVPAATVSRLPDSAFVEIQEASFSNKTEVDKLGLSSYRSDDFYVDRGHVSLKRPYGAFQGFVDVYTRVFSNSIHIHSADGFVLPEIGTGLKCPIEIEGSLEIGAQEIDSLLALSSKFCQYMVCCGIAYKRGKAFPVIYLNPATTEVKNGHGDVYCLKNGHISLLHEGPYFIKMIRWVKLTRTTIKHPSKDVYECSLSESHKECEDLEVFRKINGKMPSPFWSDNNQVPVFKILNVYYTLTKSGFVDFSLFGRRCENNPIGTDELLLDLPFSAQYMIEDVSGSFTERGYIKMHEICSEDGVLILREFNCLLEPRMFYSSKEGCEIAVRGTISL